MLDRLQSSPHWQKVVTVTLAVLLLLVSIAVLKEEYLCTNEQWRNEQDHMEFHLQNSLTGMVQDLESISRYALNDGTQGLAQARSHLASHSVLLRSVQWLAVMGPQGKAPMILHHSAVLGGFDPLQDPAIHGVLSADPTPPTAGIRLVLPDSYRDSISLGLLITLPDRSGTVLAMLDGREFLRDVMAKWPHPVSATLSILWNERELASFPHGVPHKPVISSSFVMLGHYRLAMNFYTDPPSLLPMLFSVRVVPPILACGGLMVLWLLLLRSWHNQALTPSHIPPGMGFAVVQTRRRHMEVTKASPALAHLLGINSDEVIGRPLIALICGELVDLPNDGVLHPVSPQARAKWLRLTISPSAQQQQLVLIEDITEQRQQELRTYRLARLRQLSQLVGQLSHDLKQPLNIIRLTAENALAHLPDPHQAQQGLLMAVNQSARLHELIDKTRDCARSPGVPSAPLVVVPVLRGALDLLSDRLFQLGIQLTWHPDLSTPMVLGHENRLSLALYHLLRNACDALSLREYKGTGDHPVLRVSCHNQQGQVYIVIEDNGPGMPQSILDSIRAAHPAAVPVEGPCLGLGLTLALGIIADMDGDVDVSTGPEGTIVTIRLPPVLRQWSPADRLKDGPRVLVVDDEAEAAQAIADYLSRYGWSCQTANSGNGAWRQFGQFAPHAVITDLHMPDGDGWELISRIHTLSPDIPILVVSSAESADAKRAIRAGATLFLEKPVSPKEIYQELAELTDNGDY